MTGSTERALRLGVVGVSSTRICGVRDHAGLLAEALARENVDCSLHWLTRTREPVGAARSEIAAWAAELSRELAGERPDALLLHYSVFSQAYRGIPIFVPLTLSALRRTRIPLVSFMHEFAFPWGREGLHGAAWALSQRAALVGVMRASAAAVVTVHERVDWLASRPWLPRRPVALAPVFSTLPPPSGAPRREHPGALLGLFGYSCRQSVVELVLDALAALRARGQAVTLMLLGAPGAGSAAGEMWTRAARARSLEQALSFSGTLSSQELSDRLAGCELLLFADRPGPTSRKTTLAGSLASGTALVAIDGPSTWDRLIEAAAAEVVPPRAADLAGAIEALLGDEQRRLALGARGRAFAEQSMGVQLSAAVVSGLCAQLAAGAGPGSGPAPAGALPGGGAQVREGSPAARNGASARTPGEPSESHSARAAR